MGDDPALGVGAPRLPPGLQKNYRPWNIAEFLILRQDMPRSLRFCYDETNLALNDLAELYGSKCACHETASSTRRLLADGNIDKIFQSGLHEFIEDFIEGNSGLGSEVAEAYHFNG